MSLNTLLEPATPELYDIQTKAAGPLGALPLSDSMLREWASGDLFGLSQNAGMGWSPQEMLGPQYLILSTAGGVRAPDGSPIALGFHTGHWEVGLLVQAAARELKALGGVPFAGAISDPCDGRTQGTTGMFDSLPYRNDAAMTFRRLIRSLPQRRGVLGVATCDKGLPAMMMALAGCGDWPSILVPGGVTLPPEAGEDAGKIQSVAARYVHGQISLQEAAELGCRACASPGGGCQFLGTAATSQVVGEALGMTLPHAALSPSGQPIWLDMARRSATVLHTAAQRGLTMRQVLTDKSIENAMVVHAAFGGSTNLLLHIPAIAHAGRLRRPTVDDWSRVNRSVPRLVDALPNGPVGHPTIQVFLAGGVPEVMLHLRAMNLLHLDALTVTGQTLDEVLDWWETSERRKVLRDLLQSKDGIDPDNVILSPARARERGLTSTVSFIRGNAAPQGAIIKSTSIDPTLLDDEGVYRKIGPARVFYTERSAMAAIKGQGGNPLRPGDVLVLCCRGPQGSGMEEIAQITIALKHLTWGKQVAVITDARFSGVSTGACIGHIGPEALAGGPIGKLREGDLLQIAVNCRDLSGEIDLIGSVDADGIRVINGPQWGSLELANRPMPEHLQSDPKLPDDTRLWAALQAVSGGTWGGCVYDVESIVAKLQAVQTT